MNDKKMISIDQFDADERLAVEQVFRALAEKYRQRTGKEPDSKKEREFTSEARQQVMARKLEKARAQAEKQKNCCVKRNLLHSRPVKSVISAGLLLWRKGADKGGRLRTGARPLSAQVRRSAFRQGEYNHGGPCNKNILQIIYPALSFADKLR